MDKAMSKEQLTQYADEKLGIKLDSSMSKQMLLDAIENYEGAQKEMAKKETEASVKEISTPSDPIIKVRFMNIEFPGCDMEFTFKPDDAPKDQKHYKGHLYDGQEYELPLSVVKHLNTRVVPNPQYEVDQATGQVTGNITQSVRNRFSCIPTDLDSFIKKETKNAGKTQL